MTKYLQIVQFLLARQRWRSCSRRLGKAVLGCRWGRSCSQLDEDWRHHCWAGVQVMAVAPPTERLTRRRLSREDVAERMDEIGLWSMVSLKKAGRVADLIRDYAWMQMSPCLVDAVGADISGLVNGCGLFLAREREDHAEATRAGDPGGAGQGFGSGPLRGWVRWLEAPVA
jgi:hypothetical protein